VPNGTGIIKNVSNALKDGLSTPLEFAHQLMIGAQHGIITEFVLPAIMVITLIMENVKLQPFFVNKLILMEVANHVIMVMSSIINNAGLFLN
jgi:hypothetical protein